ncbi:MAG: nuclear transport factor 2 family protein [Burkholderiales bacterium]
MHAHAELIEHFYASFARRDAAAMAACYVPEAEFRDPVFAVEGADVAAMWAMLCDRGRDLTLAWRDVRADDTTGAAHWEPRYTFSVTGRPVHNVIESRFTFRDGRIATHRDTFDLWRWSRMAIGPKAVLLGWTPFVQNAIRAEARRGFDGWKARRAASAPAVA